MRLVACFGKNFRVPAQQLFDPLDEWPGVTVIGKQMDQAWETPNQFLQEQARAITIAEVGSMHENGQDQALGINEQVPFATEDFFSQRRSRVLGLARDWF